MCIVRTILADVRQVVKPAAVIVMPASTALSPIHHSAVLNTGDTTAGLAPSPVAVAVPDLFACTHTLIQSNTVNQKSRGYDFSLLFEQSGLTLIHERSKKINGTQLAL